jgi:hypothetical protein
MHNGILDRRHRIFIVLKSCARIVGLSFLAVCGIMLLLYGGIAIHYCCSGRFENRVASLKDLAEYIIASDSKRNSWGFSPMEFDFGNTNRVYVIEFSPRLARKHNVYFSHNRVESLNRMRIEKLVNGVVLQIAISNAQTGALYEKAARVGFSTSQDKVTPIYTFSTADLPWKYTDKLRIEIRPMALNINLEESEADMNKTELLVSEGVPFY